MVDVSNVDLVAGGGGGSHNATSSRSKRALEGDGWGVTERSHWITKSKTFTPERTSKS